MNLKTIWQKWFPSKPTFNLNPEHHVSLAFTSDGTEYYRFTDEFNIPSERGFAAFHHYECLAQRCDYEFLKSHVEAIQKTLGEATVVKVGDALKLNAQLQERLTMFYPPDLIWNLASVLFFDKT